MVTKQHYQAYAAATQTVARTRQIVMLYEGAIRFVQQAKEAIAEKRIEDRYHLLVRASDIIIGLQGCLDFENGGDIAKILYQYYSSIDSRIFSIHRDNSLQTCDDVIADLKRMRDVWHEIDQSSQHQSPQAAVTAAAPVPEVAPSATVSPSQDTPGAVTVSA